MLLPGVHERPAFAPPLHLLSGVWQIGQGWMKVRHVPPPGQSALVTHPKPALLPPMHCPVSHSPLNAQSASEQHGVFASSPPPLSHRPKSLSQVPPEHVPAAWVPQPLMSAQGAPGVVDPLEHRIVMLSPTR